MDYDMQKERSARRQAGFSLIELVITLLVTSVLLLAVLATFDFNGRVSRVQTNVADMQQSLRVAQQEMVRWIRMTGRGGLKTADPAQAVYPPGGIAVRIDDNVAANTRIVASAPKTAVVEGTDVLTVRGVFSSPLYQLNYTDSATFSVTSGANPTGTIKINDTSIRGVPQDLAALKQAITQNTSEALLLVSPFDDLYAVVELVPGASSFTEHTVTIGFQTSGDKGAKFVKLSAGGAYPAGLKSVNYMGILEEYKFYVRDDHINPDDPTTDPMPKLARARLYPGTTEPYGGADNAHVDVADNILDLQVAMGFNSANAGGATGEVMEVAGGNSDDWLLNRPTTAGITAEIDDAVWKVTPTPPLYYLRLSTLARTERRDLQYQAPVISNVEDHQYPSAGTGVNGKEQRMYRRRVLQTVIDLRNLG